MIRYWLGEVDVDVARQFLEHELQADMSALPVHGRCVAARGEQGILGVCHLYRNWLHPTRWRVGVHVTPGARRRGIGTSLLRAVCELLPEGDRALQVAVDAQDNSAIRFLRHNGFELLMTTRMGSLNPLDVSAVWLSSARREREKVEEEGYRVMSLEDAPDLADSMALFHGRIYHLQHDWDPPASLGRDQCVRLFMDTAELIPGMQYVVSGKDGVHAIASLRRTSELRVFDLGWVGASPETDERRLICGLIATCVERAAREGAMITWEIDRADPVLNTVAESLPVTWSETLLTHARVP